MYGDVYGFVRDHALLRINGQERGSLKPLMAAVMAMLTGVAPAALQSHPSTPVAPPAITAPASPQSTPHSLPSTPSSAPTSVTPSSTAPTSTGAPTSQLQPPSKIQVKISPEVTATAKKDLSTIQIHPIGSMTGYDREREFGKAWTDKAEGVDLAGNKCDTRNDILSRDLTNTVKKSGDNCIVDSGTLNDPYTGKTIEYKRGRTTSGSVDVDHLVSLGNAWVSNGDHLTQAGRVSLANDPNNLLAVDASENRSKGDKSADQWLPKNQQIKCWYVVSQINVKKRYGLTVTDAEKNAMNNVLDTDCAK